MARQATIKLDVRAADAREELGQLERSLSDVEIEAVEAGDGFSRLSNEASRELAETRAQAARTAASMDQMSTSARGSANSLGIELTQAAQDASFGVAGVANQLPQLQLEFQRLQKQTGSTTGALSQLGSAFIGPTGVLAAGTLLLQFWPQIVSAFSDAGDEAEEASEKVKALAEATGSVVEVTSDQIQDLELSLHQVDQAVGQTESRIGSLQERITQLQGLQDFIQGAVFQDTDIPLRQIGTAVQAVERTSITFEQLRQAREQGIDDLQSLLQSRLETAQEELDTERGVKQNLTDQQQELERQLKAQERLRDLGAERTDTESDNADAAERQAQAYNALAVSAKQAAENARTVQRFMQQRGQMPMQRRLQAFEQQRMPTVAGTMNTFGRSQGDLMLQAARDAGVISDFTSAKEMFSILQRAAKEQTEEGTEEGLSTGARVGANVFQGTMSTAVSEITRQIENDFARAITSAVLQSLSSAAVEKLTNLLESNIGGDDGAGDASSLASQGLSLVNNLLSQRGGGGQGGLSLPGIGALSSGGGGGASMLSSGGPIGAIALASMAAGNATGELVGDIDGPFERFLATVGGPVGGLFAGLFEGGGRMPAMSMGGIHPPEFAITGSGAQIVSKEKTEQVLQQADRSRGMDAVVRKLDQVAQRVDKQTQSLIPELRRGMRLDPHEVAAETDRARRLEKRQGMERVG